MTPYKILVTDDDESVRDIVESMLKFKGFDVISTTNGREAVEAEEKTHPDLVILDVEMPVMSGFEACRIIREKRSGINYVPVIFLSGLLDKESILTGLQIGADDYIRKPFEPLELLNRIDNLLRMKNLISQVESLEGVVFSLVKSIEARDFYTAGHSRRVANISASIARGLGLADEEIEIIRKSALLHDIGKIGVPDQILNKQGKLLEEEFNRIKEHPVLGGDICSKLRLVPHALDIIKHHHEKLDGSGYPDGLKDADIDTFVRIATVADIFDALTTNRPYRPSKTNEEALEIMKHESNDGKLDMKIIECLEKLVKSNIVKKEDS